MMNVETRELAEIMFAKKTTERTTICVPLTIDDIDCDCRIEITSNDFTFWLEAKNIQDEDEDYLCLMRFSNTSMYEEVLTMERIETDLISMIEILKKAKFDIMTGWFSTETIYKEKIALRNAFGDLHRENKKKEKCYGCLNDAITKTSCGHVICFACFDKSLEQVESFFQCGICRRVIESNCFQRF